VLPWVHFLAAMTHLLPLLLLLLHCCLSQVRFPSFGNEGALRLPNQLGACFNAKIRLHAKQAVGQARCARWRHTLQRSLLYKLLDIDRRSGRGWFAGRQHMLQRSLLRKLSSQ
jgi:hypothetical protein